MTNQSEYTNKEELKKSPWESGLWEELTHDQLIKLDEVVLPYIASRESALLSRVREEVIGEDEVPMSPYVSVARHIEQNNRSRLKATQRTKLDQLSKERE